MLRSNHLNKPLCVKNLAPIDTTQLSNHGIRLDSTVPIERNKAINVKSINYCKLIVHMLSDRCYSAFLEFWNILQCLFKCSVGSQATSVLSLRTMGSVCCLCNCAFQQCCLFFMHRWLVPISYSMVDSAKKDGGSISFGTSELTIHQLPNPWNDEKTLVRIYHIFIGLPKVLRPQ